MDFREKIRSPLWKDSLWGKLRQDTCSLGFSSSVSGESLGAGASAVGCGFWSLGNVAQWQSAWGGLGWRKGEEIGWRRGARRSGIGRIREGL